MFAFEREDPHCKCKQQHRWTCLPQGFTESPNLFGRALEDPLKSSVPGEEIQILQYVDDLLISGKDQEQVKQASISLLNFLGDKELKGSKKNLQFVEEEIKYLGHLIGKG